MMAEDLPGRSDGNGPAHDTSPTPNGVVVINGRGRIVGALAWPAIVFCSLVALFGLVLLLVPGADLPTRALGAFVACFAGLCAWMLWFLLVASKRLEMCITKSEIRILDGSKTIGTVRRDDIGCLVRWGTQMFHFDHDDHLVGEWNLAWNAGIRSEQLFKRAMREFDYPCRIFYHRPRPNSYRGPGGPVEYIEMARTGAMERLGKLELKDKWAFKGSTIAPGPGISEGPMAEYVAATQTAEVDESS